VDINLRAGETLVVAPATGSFGSAAVNLALAMGARVIAMGRNTEILSRMKETYDKMYPADRLLTVPITGNQEDELAALKKAAGSRPIDAFFDISPDMASNATYFTAAILSLRHSGRVSLMGGQRGMVQIPMDRVMHFNLQLKGKWMYERDDVAKFIRLVENGNCPIGRRAGLEAPKEVGLEQWRTAFDFAAEQVGGTGAVLVPGEV
jgi:threonine dehydrogenase-like Zn-dependent dehydrogenase